MNTLQHHNLQPEPTFAEGISAAEIVDTIARKRIKIIVITGLSVLLSVGFALFTSKYRSEGFLQFGGPIPGTAIVIKDPKEKTPKEDERNGIALADYKRYAAAFATSERFEEFLKQNKLENMPGVSKLTKVFSSRDGMGSLIEPVYPFTKLDAKDLMEQPKDAGNNAIGLKIAFLSDSPETSRQIVGLLGRYAMDSIMYLAYTDSLRFKHSEVLGKITKLENTIIEDKVKLDEAKRQREALSGIVSRYPGTSKENSGQIVSVTEDNARYLSPVTHLMSTEIQAAEITQLLLRAQREQQQNYLLLEYYDKVRKFMDQTKSGEAILRGLEPIKDAVFKTKNLDDETVKEIYNTISLNNQNGLSLYLEKSRFIAGPSLPTNRTTSLSTVVILSAISGFLLALLIVLGKRFALGGKSRSSQGN